MADTIRTFDGLDFKTKVLLSFGGVIFLLTIKDSFDKYWESTLESGMGDEEKASVLNKLAGVLSFIAPAYSLPSEGRKTH